MQLECIAVSPDGTHHRFKGRAFYQGRFTQVLKFHPPGLAAVADDSGHYHITLEGRPAYQRAEQHAQPSRTHTEGCAYSVS